MRKSLVQYVGDLANELDWRGERITFKPHTILYSRVGDVGVYCISDRDRRMALLMRHYDEHRCPGGIADCEEGMRLFNNLHPHDKVLVG